MMPSTQRIPDAPKADMSAFAALPAKALANIDFRAVGPRAVTYSIGGAAVGAPVIESPYDLAARFDSSDSFFRSTIKIRQCYGGK
jgi:hypothetical protein